ncbi:NepR family anti-sigma factor [Maricaulis sp.]|jgi:hypothetical protein|uniref:NepR family anti-sigma factor n=1 Tax=Maricaulis sp. TaxID=1486257 RepID=UPI0026020451|nr:NepR family anti-sigma factor [Maricaulis sp.]
MHTMRDETGDSRPPKAVDADTARSRQQLIGQQLRTMYHSVLDEGVPDEFEQLLAALDGDSGEGGEIAGSRTDRSGEDVCDG